MYTQETHGIEVTVQPFYISERSKPELNYYFFTYKVTITNHSGQTRQLLSRHWIIRDGNGIQEEVRGEGVVGQKPTLSPGQSYEYTSACPLSVPTGSMRGSYEFVCSSGKRIKAKIPLFFLRIPSTASTHELQ